MYLNMFAHLQVRTFIGIHVHQVFNMLDGFHARPEICFTQCCRYGVLCKDALYNDSVCSLLYKGFRLLIFLMWL